MKFINNKLVMAVCVALSVTACSPKMTAEQYIAEAKGFSEKQEHARAIIALKNAAQLNVKDPAVRYALGEAYLAQGDYFNAEHELEKAESLGSNNVMLIADLVQVKVKLNKFDYVYEIAEKSLSYPDEQQVIILTYAGISAIHENKLEQAKGYIEQAINISDDSIYGNIGKAYISHSGNNYQNGLATVEELLDNDPNFAEAILLKGYLLQAAKEFELAATTFLEYSKLRPKDLQVRFFVAQNYVYAENYDEAEPYVDQLLKISELHPLANQLKAEIAYSRNNYKLAKDHAVISFQQHNNFHISKIIAGMSAYKLGDFEQSYLYLNSLKDVLPPQHLVRKLLVDLQIKLGYDLGAVSDLQSLANIDAVDPEMLTFASNQMIASGNIEAAQELLQSSIDLESSNPVDMANQGVTQLRLNQGEQGIGRLEEALKLDPELLFAEQSLAIGYLEQKQYGKALEIAKKWQLAEDKKVQGFLLESMVLDKQSKIEDAQQLLIKVLELDNSNTTALYKLGLYAHQDNNIELAFNYYTKVIKQNPQHIRTMINLLRLVGSPIDTDGQYLQKAMDFYSSEATAKPKDNNIKLGLALINKRAKNNDVSIELLQEIANSPSPLNGVEVLLGDSYQEQGDLPAAIAEYQRFVDANPKSLGVIKKLLITFEQAGEFEKALQQVQENLDNNKDNAGLLLLKAYYQSILSRKVSLSDIDNLKANKNISNHWLLDKTLGNLAYNKKNFNDSVKFYASAYSKEANSVNLINWSKSVALNGNKQKAVSILESHIKSSPEGQSTINIKAILAGVYLSDGSSSKAIAEYESILKEDANHIISLNNLSNLMLDKGNKEEALRYAEKAASLAEKNPQIIDTYAQALVANKQFILAVEQYDKALVLDSSNVKLSIDKAEALKLSNQNNKAKSLLMSIKTDKGAEQARISQLLNGL
jgi:putative PEP-CTERM system TPR-repeat lipoprotein